ncbi:MAG: LTA synthase family protein [Thermodesulfobacteriota bacterium]
MMQRLLDLVRSLLLLFRSRHAVFLLFLFGYTAVMEQLGGFPALLPAWRFEIPLLLYLSFFGNTITRKSRWQPLIVALPIVVTYAIFDLYRLQLGRMPRIVELAELPELFAIMPLWLILLAGLFYGVPPLLFLWNVRWRAPAPIALGLLPLIGLSAAVAYFPAAFMAAFETTQKEIVHYSDVISAGNNGRISMALYNEAQRRVMLEKTAHYREHPFYLLDKEEVVAKVKKQRHRRNVHLIVLESFLDPELLLAAKFSRTPTHPDFEKIFKRKGSLSHSPVFGGATGQAEFELLCGVPALRELSGVEFNVFTGSQTPCLPNLLSEAGYHTMASNGYRPDFFNSINAYAGIGFEKAYYPTEYAPAQETYLTRGDVTGEKYMFDGDLLGQNLRFVSFWLREHPHTPLFNYVLTMYGHTPNEINTEKRPEIIKVSGGPKDDHLQRAVNQYYYRTQAIAAFVKELVRIDPKSLIILVSDHLPPLECGPNTYDGYDYLGKREEYLYLNRIFFVENGRSVEYNTIHHYEVPNIILSYVSRSTKRSRGTVDTAAYYKAYLTIMAQAMDVKKLLPAASPAPAASAASPETGKKKAPQPPRPH